MSRSFEDRHIGPTSVDEAAMLKHLGYSDLTTFIKDVVPANILIKGVIEKALDHGKSEVEVIAELREIAAENKVFRSLIGTGYYGTIVPPVVKRNVLENHRGTPRTHRINQKFLRVALRRSLLFKQ